MEHREILEGLESRDAYPFDPGEVEIVQTEISSVVLAGDYAYKLKKPVRMEFLDFSTLHERLHFCEVEVSLNRRLAPDVYLGVVPIVPDGGRVLMEGSGEPLEYAVKMKRLPQERMMNVLLGEERVEPETVDEIAGVVARFHQRVETGPETAAYGAPDRLSRELDDDLRQLEDFAGGAVSPDILEETGEYLRRWLREHRRLLKRRAGEGRIRDCHGDMHSRNICLPGDVVIFDCIEFNEAFRCIDVAREVAFLAMDLDSYDQPALSERYVERYVELSGDAGLPEILDFYKAWLAVVRGKIYSIPLVDVDVSPRERKYSILRAKHYLELAHRYSGGRAEPLVLVMMGVMGSGKSAIARELAGGMRLHVLDSDFVRKSLAGVKPEERREVGFGEDIYSPEMTERVYAAMVDATREMTRAGYSVILDASFSKRRHREAVLGLFADRDIQLLFVECTAGPEVLERRLAERQRSGGDYSDGRPELLSRQMEEFEEPREVPPEMLLELNTDRPLDESVDRVEDRIRRLYGGRARVT